MAAKPSTLAEKGQTLNPPTAPRPGLLNGPRHTTIFRDLVLILVAILQTVTMFLAAQVAQKFRDLDAQNARQGELISTVDKAVGILQARIETAATSSTTNQELLKTVLTKLDDASAPSAGSENRRLLELILVELRKRP